MIKSIAYIAAVAMLGVGLAACDNRSSTNTDRGTSGSSPGTTGTGPSSPGTPPANTGTSK